MKLILQQNINLNDYNEIVSVCNDLNIIVQPFFRIPFSDEIPDVGSDCFVYGVMADNIYTNKKYYSGVFYHSNDLNIEELFEQREDLMWNKNNIFIDNKDPNLENILDMKQKYFIRPVLDDKFIAGTTLSGIEIKEWFSKISEMDIDKRFMISDIKKPETEFRFFVVDNKIVSYSRYIGNMETNNEIINFAQNFVSIYKKYPCYVVDIAINQNDIGLMEINSIHNSGFYQTDKKQIFYALKQYIDNM